MKKEPEKSVCLSKSLLLNPKLSFYAVGVFARIAAINGNAKGTTFTRLEELFHDCNSPEFFHALAELSIEGVIDLGVEKDIEENGYME